MISEQFLNDKFSSGELRGILSLDYFIPIIFVDDYDFIAFKPIEKAVSSFKCNVYCFQQNWHLTTLSQQRKSEDILLPNAPYIYVDAFQSGGFVFRDVAESSTFVFFNNSEKEELYFEEILCLTDIENQKKQIDVYRDRISSNYASVEGHIRANLVSFWNSM